MRSERTQAAVGQKDYDDIRQPGLRFYDEDTRPSSEFQTSGFNTPRVSEETLEIEVRQSEDLV